MAIFNDFPYSNLHNENLQWIINALKQTEGSIDDINKSIKQIESDIDNLDIPANIAQITSNFKNDYFIICGDSYGVERSDYKTWPMLLRDKLNLPEINYQNISIGGYGFVGESGTHLSQLMAAEIQADKKKVTKIFVGCGYNDRNATVSAINEAMIQYDKYVRSTFPNAEITLIFAACDNNRANWENLAKVKLAYAYGSRLGWSVIDIHCFIGGMYYMRDDGHHPNEAGSMELYKGVLSHMYGSQYYRYFWGSVAPNVTITSSAFNVIQVVSGDCIRTFIKSCPNIVFETPSGEGVVTTIGTISEDMYGFGIVNPLDGEGSFIPVRDSDNNYGVAYGAFSPDNGQFEIGFRVSPSGVSNVKVAYPCTICNYCDFLRF